jgi:hypothetical protein
MCKNTEVTQVVSEHPKTALFNLIARRGEEWLFIYSHYRISNSRTGTTIKYEGKTIAQTVDENGKKCEKNACLEALEWMKKNAKEYPTFEEVLLQKPHKPKKSVGKAKAAHGRCNERLAYNSFALAETLPSWFKDHREATKEEDEQGIDLVINSHDLGPLYIQIKSSRRGEIKFLDKGRRSRLIEVIVIRANETKKMVLEKILEACEKIRTQILERRGQKNNASL